MGAENFISNLLLSSFFFLNPIECSLKICLKLFLAYYCLLLSSGTSFMLISTISTALKPPSSVAIVD